MSDTEVQYGITVTVFTDTCYKFVIIHLTKVKSHKWDLSSKGLNALPYKGNQVCFLILLSV